MNTSVRYIMTININVKIVEKEYVSYFDTDHNFLDQWGIIRMYHICMIVFISVRLE